MKLVPYEKKYLQARMYKPTKNAELLEEFASSGLDAAKVEGWTNATAYSATSSLNWSIKRFKYANIKSITRNGEVFLIRTT